MADLGGRRTRLRSLASPSDRYRTNLAGSAQADRTGGGHGNPRTCGAPQPGWLRTGRRRVLLWIGGAATVALVFLGTPFARPTVHFLAVLLALGSTLLTIFVWLGLRPEGKAMGTGANVGTMVVSLILMLLAGEAVFTLTPRSHAVGYTLAARLWFERIAGERASPMIERAPKARGPNSIRP